MTEDKEEEEEEEGTKTSDRATRNRVALQFTL